MNLSDSGQAVRLSGISKNFGGTVAVKDLSLQVAPGEFLFLLGPSGSGKTTLLRLIGGYEQPSGGTIEIGGQDVTRLPVHRRNIGMVFQNYALFPHMTVAQNVAFGLKMRRVADKEVKSKVAEALQLVELDGLAGRYPSQLSGGQQQRFGLRLVETYGQSEWAAIWVLHPTGQTRIGAAGKAPTRAEVRIVDPEGQPLPPGELGQIIMHPAEPGLMMSGYYRQPELNARVFKDGWYYTGDAGEMDEDGYLYFRGRLKDYIRRRGENISAFEIERVVNTHPAVQEAAVVGVPSELSEEEVKLCMVLKPDQPVSEEELWQFCKVNLPRYMVPRYIEIFNELPRTATQRVRKFMLVETGTATAWDHKKPKKLASRLNETRMGI